MKLAFLSANGSMGGAERSLYDVLASLRAARPLWELTPHRPGRGRARGECGAIWASASSVVGVPARARATRRRGRGRACRAIASGKTRLLTDLASAAPGRRALLVKAADASCDASAPDVIHANGLKPQLLAVWARRRAAAGRLARPRLREHAAADGPAYQALRAALRGGGRELAERGRRPARGLRRTGCKIAPALQRRRPRQLLAGGRAGSTSTRSRVCRRPSPARSASGLLATLARWKGHETFLKSLSMLPADARRARLRHRRRGLPDAREPDRRRRVARVRGAARARRAASASPASSKTRRPPSARSTCWSTPARSPSPSALRLSKGWPAGARSWRVSAGGAAEILRRLARRRSATRRATPTACRRRSAAGARAQSCARGSGARAGSSRSNASTARASPKCSHVYTEAARSAAL